MHSPLHPRPVYPPELEAAWLTIACRVTRRKRWPHAIRDLLPDIATLSDTLTTDREPGFANYAHDKRSILSYGVFFFPQTYQRAAFTLSEWLLRHQPLATSRQVFRVLDAGAGAGASTFATLDLLTRHASPDLRLDITAVDRSPESLKRLHELYRDLRTRWPRARLRTDTLELPHLRRIPNGPFDLVLVSFALNELIEERGEPYLDKWLAMAMKCVRPGGSLILLEPATQDASLRLQRLRDRIAETATATIGGPCLHHRPCPLLALGTDTWCHEVKTWQAPESMRIANQTLRRDIAVLKWSFLILTNTPPPPAPDPQPHMRLVTPLLLPKGKLAATGCGADGHLHPREILARNFSARDIKDLKSIERGDLVEWPAETLLGDGTTYRSEHPPTRTFGFE